MVVFGNGRLMTLDSKRPWAWGMVVEGGRIVAVGEREELERVIPPAASVERVDLGGRVVVPGFCDSHVHLFWYGAQLLRQADLVGVGDVGELQGRLSEVARRTEGWIQGHGFDQSKMAEGRFVTRGELDRVSKSRPIIVSRICGHAAVVNSAALALVSEEERRAGDESSGLYTEGTIEAFYRRVPALSEGEMEGAVLAGARVALKTGITSVHALLDVPSQMTGYSRLRAKGQLPIRVVGLPPYAAVEELHRHGVRSGLGDDVLRFGGAKFFSDGSLGAQTALLSSEYSDKRGEMGIRIYEPEDLKRKCRDSQEKGFQVAIHAIGDQALVESLDAIEYALGGESNRVWRHRVEHASLVRPDCLERLARLGVVVTCQPQFVTSDTWTPDRIGRERASWAYPFRSLMRAGVPITLSSDCPVEKLDAFDCIAAAVGRHVWSPEETLTVEEAIYAYCMGSAYAAGMEDRVGSLAVGKYADFVVLSGDPTRMSADQIRKLRAEEVYVIGKRVER